MNETPLPKMAFTLDETAQVLGVSRSTVARLVTEGKLRVSVIGHRTRRVSPEAIQDLLRSHERTGSASKTGRRFVRRDGAQKGEETL